MRFGGRQKGTPNKRSQELRELVEEAGANPILLLALVAAGDLRKLGYWFGDDYDPESQDNMIFDKKFGAFRPRHMAPLDVRLEASKELAPYIESKLKALEIKAETENKTVLSFISQDEFNKPKDAA